MAGSVLYLLKKAQKERDQHRTGVKITDGGEIPWLQVNKSPLRPGWSYQTRYG